MSAHVVPTADFTTEPEDAQTIAPERYGWVFAISGVVSITIGVLVMAYPDPSVKLLGVFVGVDLLIVAATTIVRSVSEFAHDGSRQGTLLLGILALITGAVVIRNPGETIVLLAVALAIYLIVAGALALADALISSKHRLVSAVSGVALAGAGTVMLCWPSPSLDALVILAGVSLCIHGLVDLAGALLLRAVRRADAQ